MSNQKFCQNCGKQIDVKAVVCVHCGVETPKTTIHVTKSRSIAIVFALFLGGIGAHRFYMNRPFSGVMYLLFCWTFIPALLSILEIIGYLCISDEDFNKMCN